MERITWVECPRDAMQGWHRLFSLDEKVHYVQELAHVGFDVLDVGSFVSPRAVPQMADTAELLRRVNWPQNSPERLVIVGNRQGAENAVAHSEVDAIGYPFSLSEGFQQRNTQRTREQALLDASWIVQHAHSQGKKAVIYLSMAFGNPYGEKYTDSDYAWALDQVALLQADAVSISDTIGSGTPESIFSRAVQALERLNGSPVGMHLHVREEQAFAHLEAAWEAGIRRFDTALRGIGGCPFAQDHLVGNMPAEKLLSFANRMGATYGVRPMALESAHNEALRLFK